MQNIAILLTKESAHSAPDVMLQKIGLPFDPPSSPRATRLGLPRGSLADALAAMRQDLDDERLRGRRGEGRAIGSVGRING